MALTIATADVTGEQVEREGSRLTKVVALTVTGDGTAATNVSGAMTANWWRAHGIHTLVRVEQMSPLTEATPDEDQYHDFKFSSDFLTLYIGDDSAGAPVDNGDANTARMKLVGF